MIKQEAGSITAPITLIGIQEDGDQSLSHHAYSAINSAQILAGPARLLAHFSRHEGETLPLTGSPKQWVREVIELGKSQRICVLTAGDPLFFGIGHQFSQQLQAYQFQIIPALSSIQIACARLGLSWQNALFVNLHQQPLGGLVSQLQQVTRAVVLTDKEHHPARVAQHLLEYTDFHWQVWVCEHLAGSEEHIRRLPIQELARMQGDDFHPLTLMVFDDPDHQPWAGFPGHCPDSCYQKETPFNQLVSQQALRAVAVANLALRANSVVWEIGTTTGAVAIESAKQAWKGEVWAIESNPSLVVQAQANCCRHRADNVVCIQGKAPQAIKNWPAPDAIFIGGCREQVEALLTHCWGALKPGGQLVLNISSLNKLTRVYAWFKGLAQPIQVTQFNVSESLPMSPYPHFQAQNPTFLVMATKDPADKTAP